MLSCRPSRSFSPRSVLLARDRRPCTLLGNAALAADLRPFAIFYSTSRSPHSGQTASLSKLLGSITDCREAQKRSVVLCKIIAQLGTAPCRLHTISCGTWEEIGSWRVGDSTRCSMFAGELELPRTEHGHHIIASSRVTLQYVLSRSKEPHVHAFVHCFVQLHAIFTTHVHS